MSWEVLDEKRRLVLQLRRRDVRCAEIGEIVGVRADLVGRWLRLDKNDLKVSRGGRKEGDARLLSI